MSRSKAVSRKAEYFLSPSGAASLTVSLLGNISYVGVAVSGKVCGNLAQSSGGWQLPIFAIVGTAVVGAVLFLALWNARASGYKEA